MNKKPTSSLACRITNESANVIRKLYTTKTIVIVTDICTNNNNDIIIM